MSWIQMLKRFGDLNEYLKRVDSLLRVIDEQADEIEKLKEERSILKANIRHKNILLNCYRNTHTRVAKNAPN